MFTHVNPNKIEKYALINGAYYSILLQMLSHDFNWISSLNKYRGLLYKALNYFLTTQKVVK